MRECFGSVVNEALIAGVPVVCSDIAGASCLVTESNGRTFSPMLPNALSQACNDLLGSIAPFCGDSLRPSLMPFTFERAIASVLSLLSR